MKIKKIILHFILLHGSLLHAVESSPFIKNQGEAFLQTQNFNQAIQLYEPFLKEDLPIWQQARARYNLGTIKLIQQENDAALNFLESIQFPTLSLPFFAHSLALNQGIAFMQKSQSLASSSSLLALDQQKLFIVRALESFKNAQKLECELEQQKEPDCVLTHQLTQWIQFAEDQIQVIHQMRREQWIKQASVSSLASLLQPTLDELNKQFLAHSSENYFSYFLNQLELTLPLWFALQKQMPGHEKEETIRQALHAIIQTSKNLKNNQLIEAKDQWQKAIDALNDLVFSSTDVISPVLLDFEIALLQNSVMPQMLQQLKIKIDQLPSSLNQETIQQAQKLLQQSIDFSSDAPTALFFLLASFNTLDTLKPLDASTPLSSLKDAIKQANHALQLSFLHHFLNEKVSSSFDGPSLIKQQQQQVLKKSQNFIPLVLKTQQKAFEADCQQYPWEQVIPLFSKGEIHAQQALPLFDNLMANEQQITMHQQQTLKNWEQALEALQNPQQSSSSSQQSSKEDINETFRLIQEMYSEDDTRNQENSQELKEW